MRILFLLCFVTLIITSCKPKIVEDKENMDSNSIKTSAIEEEFNFPEDWEGVWTGELKVYSPRGMARKIPMELHILPIDSVGYINSHQWTIIYGEDKEKGKRPYEFRLKDKEKGLYLMDEKNGIELESTLINNTFYSLYSLDKTYIMSTYERTSEGIRSKITSGSLEVSHSSGGTSEDIPEVNDHFVKVVQTALLKKNSLAK